MVLSLIVLNDQIPLKDCPIGLFISEEGDLCVKTKHNMECYYVKTGEHFFGNPAQPTSNNAELGKVLVRQCYCNGGTGDIHPEVIEEPTRHNSVCSRHPSYGLISFDRIQCSQPQTLFGSSIRHRNPIRINISHAEIDRHINHDWYHAKGKILELEMSQSQFADAITSFGQGDGVPCTIFFTERDGQIPECNFVNKADQFTAEFSDQMEETKTTIANCIKNVRTLFETKKTLTKNDKAEILNTLHKIQLNIGSNANYALDCFNEQMEATVKEAKGEIESFMQNKIQNFTAKVLAQQDEDNLKLEMTDINNPIDF